MEIITDADRQLVEQRQRHARYLRYIDREPGFDSFRGVPSDSWHARWLEDVTEDTAASDRERFVRDLADEVLARGPGRSLDVFVAWIIAYDTLRVLQRTEVPTTIHNLVNDRLGDRPDLRAPDHGREIADSIGLLRYADKLQSFADSPDS